MENEETILRIKNKDSGVFLACIITILLIAFAFSLILYSYYIDVMYEQTSEKTGLGSQVIEGVTAEEILNSPKLK